MKVSRIELLLGMTAAQFVNGKVAEGMTREQAAQLLAEIVLSTDVIEDAGLSPEEKAMWDAAYDED